MFLAVGFWFGRNLKLEKHVHCSELDSDIDILKKYVLCIQYSKKYHYSIN